MHRWRSSGWKLPALSGLLLAIAYYAPLLVPNLVAFVPVLYWLDDTRQRSTLRRLTGGLVFGLSCHLLTLTFMRAMLDFSWLASLLYLGLALVFAVRMAIAVALIGWLRRTTGLSTMVLLPCVWIVFEWLGTFGDLRMTVEHLAHSMTQYPFLIQFADQTGHYGVGAFMAAVNGGLYEVWLDDDRRRRSALALALMGGVVLGYDAWAWVRPEVDAGSVRIGFVQPDIPLVVKRGIEQGVDEWGRLSGMSREVARESPDLIVWPESAYPSTVVHWLDRPETYAIPAVQALARETGTAYLTGVEYARVRAEDDYDLYNGAMFVDASGEMSADWVAKVYLVPFVEATPFRSLLGPLVEGKGGEWRWLAGGFRPGPEDALIDTGFGRAGVLVCYEQVFPTRARTLRRAGADFQVVITNDAWFGDTLFQGYQADILRLRAIEMRSAFVRVANTGISGFVDRKGRYSQRTDVFVQATGVGEVARAGRRLTTYARFGDFVLWPLGLGLVVACVSGWWSRGPRRG